jgi:hypothetical protein
MEMEVGAMNGLDTLVTVADQVLLLPDQYLRHGMTILRSVIHLARVEQEARLEQALLVREAMEGAPEPQQAMVTQEGETWRENFRAGDPDRQEIKASEAVTLIHELETVVDRLAYSNTTERQLAVEVRRAIDRVRGMGNHEPHGDDAESEGAGGEGAVGP